MDEIFIGNLVKGGKPTKEKVGINIRNLVMHGLVSGSTGTGKSKALQVMAEQLARAGVPVLLADLKGDMSGFVRPNLAPESAQRMKTMGAPYLPEAFKANFFSINGNFIPMRLRLDQVDPALVGKILSLNSIQVSNLKSAFIYAKNEGTELCDMAALRDVLVYLSQNTGAMPGFSKASADVILRQINVFIGSGLDELFGEPSLDLSDMLKTGSINVVDLSNWRQNSSLPSVLMSFILYRLFHELDEVGSKEKPRLVLFIDEAHYLFQDANPELARLFETILRQIRSKGVSVIISTQNPEDVPEGVLAQLGCKVQFALRAFTENELSDIRYLAKSFPLSKKTDLAREILGLRIAEALISPLDEKGRPEGPFKSVIYSPLSSMQTVPAPELAKKLPKPLLAKYGEKIRREPVDFLSGLERIRASYGGKNKGEGREAARMERRQSRMVNASWNRMRWLGIFLIIILLLTGLVAAMLMYLLK